MSAVSIMLSNYHHNCISLRQSFTISLAFNFYLKILLVKYIMLRIVSVLRMLLSTFTEQEKPNINIRIWRISNDQSWQIGELDEYFFKGIKWTHSNMCNLIPIKSTIYILGEFLFYQNQFKMDIRQEGFLATTTNDQHILQNSLILKLSSFRDSLKLDSLSRDVNLIKF